MRNLGMDMMNSSSELALICFLVLVSFLEIRVGFVNLYSKSLARARFARTAPMATLMASPHG